MSAPQITPFGTTASGQDVGRITLHTGQRSFYIGATNEWHPTR